MWFSRDEERTSFDERCTNLEKELSDKAKDLESVSLALPPHLMYMNLF